MATEERCLYADRYCKLLEKYSSAVAELQSKEMG